ncbi:MAG: hypothetical protein JWQ34_2365 [Mucilaginibacter sp.]|uniref:hypothetical protein n=1 Tax=Mucilaginibacter sp. TaxID=1882438 RepID=UPI00262D78F0|nr:hypothetical protein [Mucilaginibacter sp.]MDB5004140.1 hypothetical protein [Mucilaginibacter sp.]
MKKLLLIFCIILPFYTNAQDFKTLIHQADSLNKRSKHKKALALYDKAIERIITYQEIIDNNQWFDVCRKAGDLAGNDYAKYSPDRYFVDGEKFKEKLADLKTQHVNCVFTYTPYADGGPGISYVVDPTRKFQFFPSNNKRLLVWASNDAIYMQAFGDNIYKPLKMDNQQLLDFLKENHNKFALEEIDRQRPKMMDAFIAFAFNFYWGGSTYSKSIHEPKNLVDPKQNANTYLGKLLPQIQAEAAKYYDRLKTE